MFEFAEMIEARRLKEEAEDIAFSIEVSMGRAQYALVDDLSDDEGEF